MCFFKREIDISVEQEPQNTITLEADGGVSDYNLLSNKPKINGVTVENERDGNDYGLVNKSELGDYVKKNESPTLNAGDEYKFNFETGVGRKAHLGLNNADGLELKNVTANTEINLRNNGKVEIQAPEYGYLGLKEKGNDGASVVLDNGDVFINSASDGEVEIKRRQGSAIKITASGDISLEPTVGHVVFSDGNPVITNKNKATTSALGVVKVDGTSITADTDGTIHAVSTNPHIVETYVNGTSWYRLYSDGWIEQGGIVNANSTALNYQVEFLKEFTNTDYVIAANRSEHNAYASDTASVNANTMTSACVTTNRKSTTGFYFNRVVVNFPVSWVAKGYMASAS